MTTMTSTQHQPSVSDQFLSARLHSARRLSSLNTNTVDQSHSKTNSSAAPISPRNTRRPSSATSSLALDSVPEDSRPPPTAYHRAQPSHKGKEKEMQGGRAGKAKKARVDWALDLVEAQRGAEKWSERERIILILGSVNAEVLSPLLHNASFSNTTLLIGTPEATSSIEALTSPSYLLRSSAENTIHPAIQPVTLPSGTTPGTNPLPLLIAQATSLAQQLRSNSSPTPPRAWHKRRDSNDSLSPNATPPSTPPTIIKRLSTLAFTSDSRRGSSNSISDLNSRPNSTSMLDVHFRPDMSKSPSDTALSTRTTKTRPNPRSRLSSFGALTRLKDDTNLTNTPSGSPFDAVINFIPSASDFTPQRCMQDMLQQAVVLTTGIVPQLTRKRNTNDNNRSDAEDDLPISLLHILPTSVPGPLPQVIESFLLSFLSNLGDSPREVWGSVITNSVFLSRSVSAIPRGGGGDDLRRELGEGEEHAGRLRSGVEVLLFGGVRCCYQQYNDTTAKARAFLPNWGTTIPLPGIIAEQRSTPHTLNSTSPTVYHQPSLPDGASPPYTSTRAPPTHSTKTQTQMYAQPTISANSSRDTNTNTTERSTHAMTTPELEASHSSCSSWSGGEGVSEPRSHVGSIEEREKVVGAGGGDVGGGMAMAEEKEKDRGKGGAGIGFGSLGRKGLGKLFRKNK